ncbi:hypothetical protein T484DRAFT_1775969 [Baffinella frigidus]|nr:hypothetical protein T484DRAFT_1775969 [Cryptophyta sp. CCMP2293]
MPLLAELFLDYNQIATIPNRIGRCARLNHLSLASNLLTRLPAAMKDLICITSLDVSNNRLKIVNPEAPPPLPLSGGPIYSEEVGLLPALECIDLSGNPLESPPLQVVRMGTAAVSAFLHRIQEMMETGRVDLQYCKLVDVPLDVLSYDAVHTIVLSHNDLDTLPQGIGNLRHLANLDVSFNHINNLPTEIGDCLGLQTLILSQNKLTKLPWSIGKLVNLTVLDLDLELILDPPLAVTRRGGKESVRYLKALLESRHQGVCEIHGFSMTEIPPEVMRITDILRLVLSSNGLVKLPASFVTLTRLETLKLDGNPLLKQLPRTLRSMTHIKELSVANNEYTMIPDEVFRLTNLEVLNASKNLLESVGNLIAQLANLTVLDLSMSGSISAVTTLQRIDLSGSLLPLLPSDIIDLPRIEQIKLDDVDIQGPSTLVVADGLRAIFNFLGLIRKARSTTEVELTNFACDGGRRVGLAPYELHSVMSLLLTITGKITMIVGLAQVLLSLTIATSELEFVPTDVLELSNLTYLDLRFNVLKQFPEASLTAFPFLETLVLTDNELRSMPTGTGGMTALRSLILANNLLETLPASLGKCVNLTSLDLSNNQINYLPPEAKNLTNLTQLDMEFKTLTDLQTLALVWPQWGKPPADVILQGGKVIRQFYKDLLAASGQVAGIQGALGAQSSLTLRKYNLVRLPDQLHVKGFLTHLTSLDLSANKIANISDDISRLVKLRHLNLKGCPLKRLPAALGAIENLSISADFDKIENILMLWRRLTSGPLLTHFALHLTQGYPLMRLPVGCPLKRLPAALGAIENLSISADFDKIENIPMLWLRLGEKGVLTYLRKVHIEASLGVMDLSNLQITSLPRNLLDLMQVSEMFLEGNHITAPTSCAAFRGKWRVW